MSGFGFNLTEEEQTFIDMFDEWGELIAPFYSMRNVCSNKETRLVIKSLSSQGLIISGRPFRLTKSGKRLRS